MKETRSHISHLHRDPYRKINKGIKKVEVRINDKKRQGMYNGDVLTFISREKKNNSIQTRIESANYFSSFEDVLDMYSLEDIGWNSKKEYLDSMLTYYSEDEVKKYGVVAFKIKKQN